MNGKKEELITRLLTFSISALKLKVDTSKPVVPATVVTTTASLGTTASTSTVPTKMTPSAPKASSTTSVSSIPLSLSKDAVATTDDEKLKERAKRFGLTETAQPVKTNADIGKTIKSSKIATNNGDSSSEILKSESIVSIL